MLRFLHILHWYHIHMISVLMAHELFFYLEIFGGIYSILDKNSAASTVLFLYEINPMETSTRDCVWNQKSDLESGFTRVGPCVQPWWIFMTAWICSCCRGFGWYLMFSLLQSQSIQTAQDERQAWNRQNDHDHGELTSEHASISVVSSIHLKVDNDLWLHCPPHADPWGSNAASHSQIFSKLCFDFWMISPIVLWGWFSLLIPPSVSLDTRLPPCQSGLEKRSHPWLEIPVISRLIHAQADPSVIDEIRRSLVSATNPIKLPSNEGRMEASAVLLHLSHVVSFSMLFHASIRLHQGPPSFQRLLL